MKIQDQATIALSEEGPCKKARSGQKSPGAKEPGRAEEKEAQGEKWAGNKMRWRDFNCKNFVKQTSSLISCYYWHQILYSLAAQSTRNQVLRLHLPTTWIKNARKGRLMSDFE